MFNDVRLLTKLRETAEIGQTFNQNVRVAEGSGDVSPDFISDAQALIPKLSSPLGAGTAQLVQLPDAPEDVAAIQSFVEKWERYSEQPGYSDVLGTANAALHQLTEFKNMVRERSRRRRLFTFVIVLVVLTTTLYLGFLR